MLALRLLSEGGRGERGPNSGFAYCSSMQGIIKQNAFEKMTDKAANVPVQALLTLLCM